MKSIRIRLLLGTLMTFAGAAWATASSPTFLPDRPAAVGLSNSSDQTNTTRIVARLSPEKQNRLFLKPSQQEESSGRVPAGKPGMMLLLGSGFLGLAVYGKRRKYA